MKYDLANMTEEQDRAWNSEIVGLLEERSESSNKTAAAMADDYVRLFNYENRFCNSLVEPKTVDANEIIPALDHDHPMIYIELQPDSAGAVTVDFGSSPTDFYPYGRRVPMVFQQVETQRIVKNVIELASYRYNFRTVLTELLTLKLAALADARWMRATNKCLAPMDAVMPWTGVANFRSMNGQLDYDSWNRAKNIMLEAPNKLVPTMALLNSLHLAHFKSMVAAQFGSAGEVISKLFRDGWTDQQFDNMQMIATTKDTLVPVGDITFYADEASLGRNRQYQEPTMMVKNEGTEISFYLYEVLAMLIVNQAAVARARWTF